MDILILNWKDVKNPEVGGAELIAFEFARRLVQDGHTVTFFCRSFYGCLEEEVIDGVKVIRKGNLLSVYLHAFLYYQSLSKKPHKVLEMINTIGWQTPLYIPKRKRVAYLNQLAKEVWFYEFPFPISLVGYIFEKLQYAIYRSSKFLCYSNSTKEDLVSYNIPKKNIYTFPLGIDHNRYRPKGEKSKYPLFIFVARLVRMKRADICIQAMRQVVRKFPSAKFVIVGQGPDEDRLYKIREKSNLEKEIIFVNKNNFFFKKSLKDEKVKLMQKAWGLLLPAVKEGWGMVVTEAAACGTPALVSNVSGLRDAVLDKKTGFVLSSNPSVEEIATKMIEFIEDKKNREKMYTEAIKWGNTFNWDKSYSQFRKLLLS